MRGAFFFVVNFTIVHAPRGLVVEFQQKKVRMVWQGLCIETMLPFVLFFLLELFRSSMHQDAHEFLMFIIGAITENIEADYKQSQKELEEHFSKTITNGVNGGAHTNGMMNGQHKGSSEEVAMTLAGGDEVRIKVNGTDINAVSSRGSANGNGQGTESIGDRSSIQSESTIPKPKEKVWVQKLFEGQLTNEIKCLTCEKV